MAPILPGISDRPEQLAEVVRAAREAGACGVWANLLYLRPGTREHFLDSLARDWPELLREYERLYARRAYLRAPRTRAGARARCERCAQSTGRATAAASGSSRRRSRSSSRSRSGNPASRIRLAPRCREEITCLIVDDHEVVREGLRLSLSRAPHIRIVGEAADGASAVALAERRRPDVVIMDVRMPGMDGLEATKILTEKVPDVAGPDLHGLQRALAARPRARVRREGLHPQGGAAPDAAEGDRKVVAGEGFVDPAPMPVFLSGTRRRRCRPARARHPQAARGRHVERHVAAQALHQPGDREEPRAPHPDEARGGHQNACRGDRASRSDHRLEPLFVGLPVALGAVVSVIGLAVRLERDGCSSGLRSRS